MKTALIIGSRGQDGRLLADQLTQRGCMWIGLGRDTVEGHGLELPPPVDITDAAAVARLVDAMRPDEIYYLAAYHHSAEASLAGETPVLEMSFRINVLSLLNVLEAVRRTSPASRVFYAASSHVFGTPRVAPQEELTPFQPETPYGITKAAGIHLCQAYRRRHHVFVCAGILYNHESEYRQPPFISAKIVDAALRIAAGTASGLVVGSLEARVDWGYAPEFVEAMQRILALHAPDDFVIATGTLHSVRDFVQSAFEYVGLDWRQHVTEDQAMLARRTTDLVGRTAKLEGATGGWKPKTTLPDLAWALIDAKRRQRNAAALLHG